MRVAVSPHCLEEGTEDVNTLGNDLVPPPYEASKS